ncbi:hypothetical protein L9F63_017418 [Diploptera punctata]|uniref:RB1-inducible coiled-coil protein 1 n=1 Tax=Diploptera punctata TaxID=6984 RepID=A0AAD7ZZL0_DIPPU|nr:hypothetical protein L9F63_017418 [Diploptera punctata]
MLYIFHVDTGKMMAFDMNLALESVRHLKEVIERHCGIPVDKQVLLVSGGDCLDPTMRVCSYSAGTDTNPIYLFSKSTIESQSPPSLSIDFCPDLALKDQVEATHNMNDTYATVMTRVQLAQKFYDHAHEQSRACENLVHDQHLQQQGWAAVLANLEDITQAFRNRAELFNQSFNQYLETRDEYIKMIENFRADMDILAKIPLIPALLEKQPVTLLDWVSANNQYSLFQVAQTCLRHLEQLDEPLVASLKRDIEKALEHTARTDMKEIKGLEERLYGLEQLMLETKRIVQEQQDITQSFLSNQSRANVLGDASILPDLCASHRRQLIVMLSNHQHLLDIRGR